VRQLGARCVDPVWKGCTTGRRAGHPCACVSNHGKYKTKRYGRCTASLDSRIEIHEIIDMFEFEMR